MASAFMGYVLPWGQMSFWGCTVITNLLSAVPGIEMRRIAHFLGFNSQPRRIPDFPDYFNSWNILSSIGSGLTIFAFYLFY